MNLALAAVFLPLSHFGISSTRLRDVLVARLGERPYQGLYSLISFAAFAWLLIAYRHAEARSLWILPHSLKLLALPAVFLAFVLVVVGLTTPNPTAVGAERLFDRPDVVRGIVRITRNPFLWGATLWAIAHIFATGELASILFFGSVGSLGFIGTLLLDAKKERQYGERWRRFAAQTSNVPFAAIVRGRQRFSFAEIGVWRIALATALFAVVVVAHRPLFGRSPF